jgi:hypothetical protein
MTIKQKVNIYLQPELKAIERQTAKEAGLTLSAWFRLRVKEELQRSASAHPKPN